MVLEGIRNFAFQTQDLLRGAPIRKAYNEIKRVDHLDSTGSEIKDYQKNKLDALIKHACSTVPFYKNMASLTNLEDFPVLNKVMIRNSMESFLSSSFQAENLVPRFTSGSTGVPFASYQDKNKKLRVHSEIIFYSEKAGYKIGYPLIYLRPVKKKEKKTKLQKFLQNQPAVDSSDLSEDRIETILKEIKEHISESNTIVDSFMCQGKCDMYILKDCR